MIRASSLLRPSMEKLLGMASKPGVRSTLVLSRNDGAIIRSTGLVSNRPDWTTDELNRPTPHDKSNPGPSFATEQDRTGINADALAKKIFAFVSAAVNLGEDLDEGDHVQLLRLRMRKCEAVIVPGKP